jgi:hypothetical protein
MRQHVRKMLLVLALGLVIFLPGIAAADSVDSTDLFGLQDIGALFYPGSWGQQFQFKATVLEGTFTAIECFIVSPGQGFEAPGVYDFTASGWDGTSPKPTYALATGSATDFMKFKAIFSGESTDPLAFDFFVWEDGILSGDPAATAHAVWNNVTQKWTITATGVHDLTGVDYSRAPLPGALILLGAGLVRLVAYSGRKRALA